MKAIDRAIAIAGSQDKLAKALRISQALVSQWSNGAAIHPRHFAAIQQATDGVVTPQDLLEDELAKVAAPTQVDRVSA